MERLHGEIQRDLYEFKAIMMSKGYPMDLFMAWYNHSLPHMSLNKGETTADAFVRKKAPRMETVIDEQTGEKYHAGYGTNYFLDSTICISRHT